MVKHRGRSCLFVVVLLFANCLPAFGQSVPDKINGVDIGNVNGWFANRYQWRNIPEWQTVQPVPRLSTPGQYPSPAQIAEQDRQLNAYGSGADVLELNVCPDNPDYNQWLSTYFGDKSTRSFFVLLEHVYGNCNYVEPDGPKNMDLPLNRKAFVDDIDFIFRNVILPNEHRYVTINERAVIYLWSVVQMEGDFAGLLEEVKSKYPVFFIGSVNIIDLPSGDGFIATLEALDGYMEYVTYVPVYYQRMTNDYAEGVRKLYGHIRKFNEKTGKEYLIIPTFQFAFDDTKYPGRNNMPMYPTFFREEVKRYAEWMKGQMGYGKLFNNIGPLIVYDELFEGGAVIESRCFPLSPLQYGWAGCGTDRLEISFQYFAK